MKTIEQELRIALQQHAPIRDSVVLRVLDSSIRKCIQILLKKNKKYIRLHDVDDLMQEAKITILKVLRSNNFEHVQCAIRTYLLGAVKRKVWSILREEFAVKRQAQTKAYPLDFLENQRGYLNQNKKIQLLHGQDITLLNGLVAKNIIEKITQQLDGLVRNIFIDLMDGYSIKDIAINYNLPLQTVYTLLARHIKPVARQIINVE